MKKGLKIVLKIFLGIFLACYLVVSIFLTVCLLNYNKYNITEIGDKSLILVKDDELNPHYHKGDLVVVTKNNNDDILTGDKIFFYDTYAKEVSVNLGNVVDKQRISKKETTFYMDENYALSSENVIGKAKTSKKYKHLGSILSFLESRFGFLIAIILPILITFIYLIYLFVMLIKHPEYED